MAEAVPEAGRRDNMGVRAGLSEQVLHANDRDGPIVYAWSIYRPWGRPRGCLLQ
jgi:hypothetical protein